MTGRLAALFPACGNKVVVADDSGATATLAQAVELGRAVLADLPDRRCLVFLLVANSVRSVGAYLALLDAGHPVLLLDQDVSDSTLHRLVAAYHPDRVVAPDRDARPGPRLEPPLLARDLAVLLATSGSTGSPKLARFSLQQLAANARSVAAYLTIGEAERPLLHLPFHYSFGLSVLHSHLIMGARVELTRYSIMQREFWERARQAGATSFSGVPFHYEALRRLGFQRIDAPSMRTWTQAGGRLAPEHVRYFAEQTAARGARFFVMYGQTEAGPRISYLGPEEVVDHAGSIGHPIPGVELQLVDEHGALVTTPDTEGELICLSPSIMMGYALDASDLARGDDMGGRLETGDLARRDSAGRFTITGRKSRFVKLMGTRVSLDDIEALARSLNLEAAVAGEDDLIVVGLEGGGPEDADALKRAVVETFRFPPRALQVRSFDALPRSPSGKVRYADLLALVRRQG